MTIIIISHWIYVREHNKANQMHFETLKGGGGGEREFL